MVPLCCRRPGPECLWHFGSSLKPSPISKSFRMCVRQKALCERKVLQGQARRSAMVPRENFAPDISPVRSCTMHGGPAGPVAEQLSGGCACARSADGLHCHKRPESMQNCMCSSVLQSLQCRLIIVVTHHYCPLQDAFTMAFHDPIDAIGMPCSQAPAHSQIQRYSSMRFAVISSIPSPCSL